MKKQAITVARLKAVLNQLDDNVVLVPNQLGNLAVMKNTDSEKMDGFIDFGRDGELVIFDDVKD